MEPKLCPSCQFPVIETNYFCPNCGKKLKEPPVKTSIGSQIGIYAVSIFLPPFGLVPGFKYLFNQNQKVKMIGIVAIVLSIISIVITIWITVSTINRINTTLNSQLNGLTGY